MKVALVYDRVNKWGGAERVLLSLQKLFPDAPLYTSVYHPKNALWAKGFTVIPSFVQKVPFLRHRHELVPFLMPLAFEQFHFDDFDVVISISSESAKGIITKPSKIHINYCLTPTRYLWSGYDTYFAHPLFRFLTQPVVSYLRKWDLIASQRPDIIVAISHEVKNRIEKYYHRSSEVLYPPIDLPVLRTEKKRVVPKVGYLIVSRLSHFTKYKKIDLAIQVCNTLKLPLTIIGEGNWKEELQRMSGPTIQFVGSVSDKELAYYYSHAKALLFPGLEDLGLTVIEAQSYGTPVIAYRGGGAIETMKENETGVFFNEQTTDSFISAIKKFETMYFSADACRKEAERFDFTIFKEQFYRLVNRSI